MGGRRDIVADYFDVFNNEVKQFLNPVADRELRGSRIHADSRVGWLEDLEGDDNSEIESSSSSDVDIESDNRVSSSDSSDSSDESDSRYVTAEESAGEEELKHASPGTYTLGTHWNVAEKSVFFHFLSRYSIHRLDEWRDRLPNKSKIEILIYYQVLQRNLEDLQSSNILGGLLSNEELPIAYEMDEFYVKFEEFMSRQVRIEYEQPTTDNEQSLISLNNWNKRWQAIYCKTAIEELVPLSSEPLPYSQEAIGFLTSCAKAYTKRLLWYSVLNELDKLSISKWLLFPDEEMSEDDDLVLPANNEQLPHVVTRASVYRAINILKQEGFETPTLPETVLRTLEKFEVEPKPNGKLFKNRQVTMSLLPTLLQHTALSSTSPQLQQPLPQYHPDPSPIHKKLYKLHQGKRRRIIGSFVQDDPLNCIDNPLEFELCNWEAQIINASDKRKSMLHQHALMTYYNDRQEKQLTQLESVLEEATMPCPVPKLPATLLNRFLHSNV